MSICEQRGLGMPALADGDGNYDGDERKGKCLLIY